MMADGAEAESTMGRPSRQSPATEANSTLASMLRWASTRAGAGRAPPWTSFIGARPADRADLRAATPASSGPGTPSKAARLT